MKTLVVAALTAFIVLGAIAGCAQEETVTEKREWQQSHLLIDNVNSGGRGNGITSKFNVPKHNGMIKVHYYNNGDINVRITVDKGHQLKMTHFYLIDVLGIRNV